MMPDSASRLPRLPDSASPSMRLLSDSIAEAARQTSMSCCCPVRSTSMTIARPATSVRSTRPRPSRHAARPAAASAPTPASPTGKPGGAAKPPNNCSKRSFAQTRRPARSVMAIASGLSFASARTRCHSTSGVGGGALGASARHATAAPPATIPAHRKPMAIVGSPISHKMIMAAASPAQIATASAPCVVSRCTPNGGRVAILRPFEPRRAAVKERAARMRSPDADALLVRQVQVLARPRTEGRVPGIQVAHDVCALRPRRMRVG